MDKDCLCTNKGTGVVPGPNLPKPCQNPPEKVRLTTEYLPPSLGTDAEGQPFAPRQGMYYSTVVTYGANEAVYLYDARGVYTKLNPALFALSIINGDETIEYNGQSPVTIDIAELVGDNYYTKAEIDDMIGEATTRLEAI